MADQWKSPASEDENKTMIDDDEFRGRAEEDDEDFEDDEDLDDEEDEESPTF